MPAIAEKPLPVADYPLDDDPVLLAFLNAPVDDRAETDEERAAVDAAKASARASGRMVPHDEVLLGLERARSAG